ncbi:MAG: hypothetical protein ACJ8C4_07380 [Gemmataceae bacterium]
MVSDLKTAPTVTNFEAGPIRVRIRECSQLFNSIDPSPFQERDLDRDAEQFIVSWARDLRSDSDFSLVLEVVDGQVDASMPTMLNNAIHSFFARRHAAATRDLRTLLRRGRTSLIIGLVFLSVCVTLAGLIGGGNERIGIAEIASQGLTVAGWVAMWRPMEIFLYSWWPLAGDRRLYDRLSRMPVRIESANTSMESPWNRPRRIPATHEGSSTR